MKIGSIINNGKAQFGETNVMHNMDPENKYSNKIIEDNEPLRKKIFIVHGHDNAMKFEVDSFLKGLNLCSIILAEQTGKGRTIIEKFEEESNDVEFVVILLSPDDVGGINNQELRPRARQNVIFELGYFIGKLGRSKICILVKENVEIPSDISGLGYINFSNNWKYDFSNELREAGLIK